MTTTLCTLPGGFVDSAGVLHREAELVPLSGHEEELLATSGDRSAAAVTDILCRAVRRLGTIEPLVPEVARGLLVADRQALLLALRRATFGDRVEATLSCPWPRCGARVDVDFSLDAIPIEASDDKGPVYELVLPEPLAGEEGETYGEVRFRLPTGEDQELLAPLVEVNEARAATALLERCLVAVGPRTPPAGFASTLPADVRQAIEERMEEVAPRLVLTMAPTCPECGRSFEMPFDLQDFFFGDLRTSSDLLYRQVHYLAYHYHWSEEEILGLTRDKRHRYIEILAEEMERTNHAQV